MSGLPTCTCVYNFEDSMAKLVRCEKDTAREEAEGDVERVEVKRSRAEGRRSAAAFNRRDST